MSSINPSPNKSSWVAAILSLALPGAGHFYLGGIKKSIALFVIDIGIICTFIFAASILMKIVAAMIYFAVMIPAVIETWLMAKGSDPQQFQNSKLYISVLLLVTGFSALPLLWQGNAFSKRGKIAWSIAVPVLAIVFFGALFFYGSTLESYIQRTFLN